MPTDVEWTTHSEPTSEVLDVAAILVGGSTAVVLDLDPITGLRVAADLSGRRLADVVVVLPRWPHAEAVLPTQELIAELVQSSNRLRAQAATTNVVFVLDGERARSIRRPARDPRVDNRYDVSAGDLPNLQQLRAAGIRRVVKVTHAAPMS
jgi:hypothetical protein